MGLGLGLDLGGLALVAAVWSVTSFWQGENGGSDLIGFSLG